MRPRPFANSLIAAACLYGLLAGGGQTASAAGATGPVPDQRSSAQTQQKTQSAAPAPDPDSSMVLGGFSVQPSVDLLRRLGIISGDPSGRLRLSDTITRAELAKIAVVAAGQTSAADAALKEPAPFPDVAKDHWARGYIAVARRLGIVGGYADGTFHPASPVTNAEVVTMLMRACGLKPSGPWPDAYLDVVRKAGVLPKDLERELPPGEKARRGAVFLLAERIFMQMEDTNGRSLLQRTFDNAPPGLSVDVEGAPAGITDKPEVTLAIRAPGAMLVQVNGKPAWLRDGAVSYKQSLAKGPNEIFVLATDALGNSSTQHLTVLRK